MPRSLQDLASIVIDSDVYHTTLTLFSQLIIPSELGSLVYLYRRLIRATECGDLRPGSHWTPRACPDVRPRHLLSHGMPIGAPVKEECPPVTQELLKNYLHDTTVLERAHKAPLAP